MIEHFWLFGIAVLLAVLVLSGFFRWVQCETKSTSPGPPLTATAGPTFTPTPAFSPEAVGEITGPVTITVVYDNNPYDERLRTAWGFACLVETGQETVLFDTGGDSALLLSNMAVLGLNPRNVDMVVLSHTHGDHTGGLMGFLSAADRLAVYLPLSFPESFKEQVRARTEIREVSSPVAIATGIYTPGEMGTGIIEESLVVRTAQGAVLITGCAHPGIDNIARRVRELGEEEIHLVMGGFHLGGKSQAEIESIIATLQDLKVRKVAPCHCTGEQALNLFRQAYGEDFIRNGVGKVLKIPVQFDKLSAYMIR